MPKVRMSNKQKQICRFIKKRLKKGEFQKDLAIEYGMNLGTFRNKCSGQLRWTLEDEKIIMKEGK
jgi:hypothetical protein